jgi:hypothetical protein
LPIGPDIGAPPAASLTGKSRPIGQPYIIGPSIAADRRVMAAPEIGTVDQETANASGAHFSEGDLLLPFHFDLGINFNRRGVAADVARG